MTTDKGKAQPRTAQQWFAEASRCYVEEHQGCASCRGRHCVFPARWGQRTEYHCNECDFSVAHDAGSDEFTVTPGQGKAPTACVVLEGVWETA
jgi:hypothetical protein